jgi:alpha-ketoglutarate-dependent taurine dioxygenase
MATSVNLDISQRVDIICRKGDTFDLEFIIEDADGVPVDVTTPTVYTFKMEVRENSTAPDPPIIDTTGDPATGFEITGTVDGVVSVLSDATFMETVPSGTFVYDLEATKVADSNVQTWFYGLFKVNEDITI